MPRTGPNYTALTHQVVRESPEPVAFAELVERVLALAGAATKNPKATVRSAISQSRSIIGLGDGRYGWKARLINGAVQRIILDEDDLAERELIIGDAARDLLTVNFREDDKYGVKGPPVLELAGGPTLIARVGRGQNAGYILEVGAPFWDWLDGLRAQPGDSVILRAEDAEARRYSLAHEPASVRDEALIRARGQETLDAAVAFLRSRRGEAPIWETVGFLNASPVTHHPTPPMPFEELWTPEVWEPIVDEFGARGFMVGGLDLDLSFGPDLEEMLGGPAGGPAMVEITEDELPPGVTIEQLQARVEQLLNANEPPRLAPDDPLLPLISKLLAASGLPSPTGQPYTVRQLVDWFGDDAATMDWIDQGVALGVVAPDPQLQGQPRRPAGSGADNLLSMLAGMFEDDGDDGPPDLPKAYQRGGQRRPQPSPQGRKGPVESYTLRVRYRFEPGFWRDFEIAADQNLEDLHLAIQEELGWNDDHLYSFYTGRQPFDARTEIGSPWSDSRRHTHQVTLKSLGLRKGKKLLYLFDYGDEHLFDVEVLAVTPQAPKGKYPKVVGRKGEALEQYPDEEWDEGDEEEDDEE